MDRLIEFVNRNPRVCALVAAVTLPLWIIPVCLWAFYKGLEVLFRGDDAV